MNKDNKKSSGFRVRDAAARREYNCIKIWLIKFKKYMSGINVY